MKDIENMLVQQFNESRVNDSVSKIKNGEFRDHMKVTTEFG